jgi:hypothetical protein
MTRLKAGTYTRQRGFKPADYGHAKWWITGVTSRAATASGTECIQVQEIVSTRTAGDVAIYRHWIVDPDGAEVRGTSTFPQPQRSELQLRTARSLLAGLRTMKMTDQAPDTDDCRPARTRADTSSEYAKLLDRAQLGTLQ